MSLMLADLPPFSTSSLKPAERLSHRDGSQAGYPAGGNLLHLHAAGDPDGGGAVVVSLLNVGWKPSKKPKKIYRATSAR